MILPNFSNNLLDSLIIIKINFNKVKLILCRQLNKYKIIFKVAIKNLKKICFYNLEIKICTLLERKLNLLNLY